MKNKFSSMWRVGLAVVLVLSFSLVTATPAVAQTIGTIELDADWYKTGAIVGITVEDPDLNVPAPVTGEIIGTGDGTAKTFTVDASRRPIIDVTGDGVVRPADVVVHDLQVGVVDVYAVDADTGGITLAHAPDQVYEAKESQTAVTTDIVAGGVLTTAIAQATKLKLTVTVIDTVGVDAETSTAELSVTGTTVDPVTLAETPSVTESLSVTAIDDGSDTDSTLTSAYFKDATFGLVITTGGDGASVDFDIEETHTVAADYTGSVVDEVDIEISSDMETTPETVTLTETNPNSGVFTGSIDTTAVAPDADGLLSVAHGDTITATYVDADTAVVDDVDPTISDLAPADEAYEDTGTPTISATLSDALAGIDTTSIAMTVDGSVVTHEYAPVTGVVSYVPDPGLGEASHTVTVDVSDLAGNPATQAVWSFTVDTTIPTIQTDTLTAPNGGEVWDGGSFQNITWTGITDTNIEDNPISLYYSSEDDPLWVEIATGEANDGTYVWTVPMVDSASCLVKIEAVDKAGNTASDESNGVFTIDSTWPTLLGIAWTDEDSSEGVSAGDTLLFIFSEDMDTGTVTSLDIDLPISGAGTTYGTTGLIVNWATPAGDDTLTVTLGDEVDIVVGDTVNPADTVTDPVGNPDATADLGAAILPPAPTEIAVTANPEDILPDGIAKSTITATVTMYGKAVKGVEVSFSTTAGIIYSAEPITDINGEAEAELTASTVVETAIVTASAEGVTSAMVNVIFGSDEFTMPGLVVGWNLISLPLIPGSPSIDAVLGDLKITETVEVVWSYDAATYDWYYYQPSTGLGDLFQMVDGRGYWVQMVAPASGHILSGMEMPAPGETPSQYAVVVGWNLIGFRSTSLITDADTYLASILFTKIYAYGSTGYLTLAGSENLVPGSGYWVYVTEPGYIAP